MAPVYDLLAGLASPATVMIWLGRSAVVPLLRDIATGKLPLSFESLDALPQSQAVRFVEDLLTTAGLLPGRDPVLARFEHWLTSWLQTIATAEHRHMLRRYATWQTLRRLRESSRRKWLTAHSGAGARAQLTAARSLLDFLDQQGHSLPQCSQTDVDRWAVATAKSRVAATRPFWTWAQAHNFVPSELRFPALATAGRPTAAPADAAHWDLARRLVTDTVIPARLRVAGLLVLLYAQPLSRIARLTRRDIAVTADDAVTMTLGGAPINVPEPLASQIRGLLTTPQPTTAGKLRGSSQWLFPGTRPGRPVSTDRLGTSLAGIGISVGTTRVAALAHLASTMPATVVADLLGIHPTTAAAWAMTTGGTWADYTAHRVPQPPTPIAER